MANLHITRAPEVAKDGRFLWLLSEKKWHEDIRSRKRAPDGSIVRVREGEKPRWER